LGLDGDIGVDQLRGRLDLGEGVVAEEGYADGSLGLRHAESWDLGRFFAAHFSSFIGDRRLGVTSRREFVAALDTPPPREVLVITASAAEPEVDAVS
jgi:hypothetical protein